MVSDLDQFDFLPCTIFKQKLFNAINVTFCTNNLLKKCFEIEHHLTITASFIRVYRELHTCFVGIFPAKGPEIGSIIILVLLIKAEAERGE